MLNRPRRIYVSSTSSDLKEHRAVVISALRKMGMQPICMEDYVAEDKLPVEKCLEDVEQSDIYVGIFAWRYGFIPPGYEKSITELEFRKAVEAGIPKLIFLLNESAEWPPEYCDKGQESARIKNLREEFKLVKNVGWFHLPHQLATEVQAAVHRLLQDIQPVSLDLIPIKLPRLRGNFVDREVELDSIFHFLKDKYNDLVVIVAPGGYGKTELMTKVLDEIVSHSSIIKADIKGILYFKCLKGDINLGNIFTEAGKIAGKRDEFLNVYTCRDMTTDKKLEYFFAEMSRVGSVLIVLDNFDVLLDPCDDSILDPDLREFLETSVSVEHTVRIFITSRAVPRFEGSRKAVKIDLTAGLPEDKAILYLREEGLEYGLDSEPEENLRGFVRRVYCIPKALESVLGYLDDHYPALRFSDILTDKELFADFDQCDLEKGLKSLIFQQYKNQSPNAKHLLSALSIFPKAVPQAAIRFLLQGISVTEITRLLSRLEKNRLIISNDGFYDLHPIVRDFIYERLLDEKGSKEEGNKHNPNEPVFLREELHRKAAQFYQSIPCPPYGNRSSLDEIEPMLDAIWHLLAVERAEDAAALLLDNALHENLYWWGYYDLLSDFCRRFLNHSISPKKKIALHILQGKIERNLGKKLAALSIYENAQPLINEANDPESEIGLVNALGDIHYFLHNTELAIEYLHRAEELMAKTSNFILQSENAGDMANVLWSMEEYKKAERLYEQAIDFARKAGSKTGKIYEGIWNGGLANVYLNLYAASGNFSHRENAIAHYLQAIALAEETNDRRHESHWSGVLGDLYRQLGEFGPAEAHLKKAFSISEKILYGRVIGDQAQGLVDIYSKTQDFEKACQVSLALQQAAYKIGDAELIAEAERLLIKQELNKVAFLFQEGKTNEAVEECHNLLVSFEGNSDMCASLGLNFMRWGRQSGYKDFFQLSVEAYSNAINKSSDDSQHALYSARADAYSLLGKIEEAIVDYSEELRRNPQNTGAALSRAEVHIWTGRYGEARLLIEALYPQLVSTEKIVIGAWLMCHTLNLEGRDFSAYKKILEVDTKDNIDINYSVRDIELYLKQLDQTKFSEEQIQNAWMIQSLIGGEHA